ncbi:hypothetical protein [Nonomuraea sp. NPDC050310]|uniref:hypothetical protein n=1 Tax=unclassified Nonomuraea TaxID=2593643 RepID=UPI0033E60CF6
MSEEHDRTVQRRIPTPGQPVQPVPPPEQPHPETVRLPYTPDLFPDVPVIEAKPPRSAWWWVVVASAALLVVAAIAFGIVLFATRA